ncbi:hypothetical protein [Pseudokineococcus sp. 1T1Z-3]|uniref:hypothetical protein n=1 Tax=Pseudokineococcus sp. 1T1Z-3 TaxID=3132745 RepID=UPI0030B355E6
MAVLFMGGVALPQLVRGDLAGWLVVALVVASAGWVVLGARAVAGAVAQRREVASAG